MDKPLDTQWVREQLELFRSRQDAYEALARTLKLVFGQATNKLAPDTIVQARVKSFASFAEKIQRKPNLQDPAQQFTDLCGVRVITPIVDGVYAVSRFIEENFIVDWDNSQDVSQRLKYDQFGYRSVHYIVKLKPNVFPSIEIPVRIPDELYELKAEIQVRTTLEHSWASFSHDRFYKSRFEMPKKWGRELAELAAVLENADAHFARIEKGLEKYETDYLEYLNSEELEREMELLNVILQYESKNVEIAHRIGKVAILQEKWDKAIHVLSEFETYDSQPIWKVLGLALTKKFKNDPSSDEYLRGQALLMRASQPEYQDADAIVSLASTYLKQRADEKAREKYFEAFKTDPTSTYALNMLIQNEILRERNLTVVEYLRPTLEDAIKRCQEQVEVGIDMPWAYYNLGRFNLLLGNPYEALTAYAKGVQSSSARWMIETSYEAHKSVGKYLAQLKGYEWIRRLLLIGLATRGIFHADWAALVNPAGSPLVEPIVLVAGGTDVQVHEQILEYREMIQTGFEGYRATVLSGGTTAGISGLVGELQTMYPEQLYTIGYVPGLISTGATIDARYKEIRKTPGGVDFTPLEPLQMWIDIIASGIDPKRVKLLGINGGMISAVEYRLALALGAKVGVVEGSGRAAARLIPDMDWNKLGEVRSIARDAEQLRAFLRDEVGANQSS